MVAGLPGLCREFLWVSVDATTGGGEPLHTNQVWSSTCTSVTTSDTNISRSNTQERTKILRSMLKIHEVALCGIHLLPRQ